MSTRRFLDKLQSNRLDPESISNANKKRTETMLRLKMANEEKAERT